MKTIQLFFLSGIFSLFSFSSFSVFAQCDPDTEAPLAICHSIINLSLPPSGTLILDPAFIDEGSFDNCTAPENLVFSVSPNSVSCDDIGSPINVVLTVTDEAGNSNACTATIIVEDKIAPLIACNPSLVLRLEEGGSTTLSPEILLAIDEDNCDLTYHITPASVSCADAGRTVFYTVMVTDAGGATAQCTGDVFVSDPKPSSVAINGPTSIECGATDVVFTSTVSGGYGPFLYEWEIKKGAADGWSITSGQGTPSITMDAGIKKLKLKLTITGICGRVRTDTYNKRCTESSGLKNSSGHTFSRASTIQSNEDKASLNLYPNPATDRLTIVIPASHQPIGTIRLFDHQGKKLLALKEIKTNENKTLDIASYPAGIYTLILDSSDGSSEVLRFVKLPH